MRFLELTWRVYIQHGLQGKMADYHLERAKKHKGDDSKIKKMETSCDEVQRME